VGSGNILKQIFQEIYLGPRLFQNTYGIPPAAYRGDGLIDRERLLIDPSALTQLFHHHVLAIATGRPKIEADYPLHRFGIHRFFSAVLTLDDCLQEEQRRLLAGEKGVSLSKPHPFMLDALKAAFENTVSRYYYVGDMPDDMTAAANAEGPFVGIGVTAAAADKAELVNALRRAGAAHIVHDVPSLLTLLDINTD
jgi:phosphoglycolate phosphatase-like HAD superfamily hydrolase